MIHSLNVLLVLLIDVIKWGPFKLDIKQMNLTTITFLIAPLHTGKY